MHVHSALVAFSVHPPNFIQQLLAGEDFALIGKQREKQIKFLLRQGKFLPVECHLQGVPIQQGGPHLQAVFIGNLGAAQQGAHS